MPFLSKGMCWKITLASRWQPYCSHTRMLKNTEMPSFLKTRCTDRPHTSVVQTRTYRQSRLHCNPTGFVFFSPLGQNESYGFAPRLWTPRLACNGPGIVTWELTLTFLTLHGNQSRYVVAPLGLMLAHIWRVLRLMPQQLSWGESQCRLSAQEGQRLCCCT